MSKKSSNPIKLTTSERVTNIICTCILSLFLIIELYPLIFVVSSSFSSGAAVSAGRVYLWPVEFTMNGYKQVFSYHLVGIGYRNTIFYTIVGTSINLVVTTCCAYPLARKNLQFKRFYLTLFIITMFVGGGMIPTYINMVNLHLINTMWVMVLPGAMTIGNMIIMRSFFQNSVPYELYEASSMDGITDIGYLTKIMIPLSKPVYAVITLYYMVMHWNSYFSALIYLRDRNKIPLQVVLREILSLGQVDLTEVTDPEKLAALIGYADIMKFALVVVSAAPMMIIYLCVQKFFKTGLMVGSLKG